MSVEALPPALGVGLLSLSGSFLPQSGGRKEKPSWLVIIGTFTAAIVVAVLAVVIASH